MAKQRINKHFVSTIDKKLLEFDKTHALSADQQAEIEKYRRIYKLRDNPTQEKPEEDIFGGV